MSFNYSIKSRRKDWSNNESGIESEEKESEDYFGSQTLCMGCCREMPTAGQAGINSLWPTSAITQVIQSEIRCLSNAPPRIRKSDGSGLLDNFFDDNSCSQWLHYYKSLQKEFLSLTIQGSLCEADNSCASEQRGRPRRCISELWLVSVDQSVPIGRKHPEAPQRCANQVIRIQCLRWVSKGQLPFTFRWQLMVEAAQ